MGDTLRKQSGGAESLPMLLISEIADREGVDPIELTPPMNSSIDVDALKKLFTGDTDGFIRIQFTYCGHQITIENDEKLRVEAK